LIRVFSLPASSFPSTSGGKPQPVLASQHDIIAHGLAQRNVRSPYRNGCSLQCGEEEDWDVLLHPHLFFSMQVPSLQWLVRDPDRSSGSSTCKLCSMWGFFSSLDFLCRTPATLLSPVHEERKKTGTQLRTGGSPS
jgi:hypothetical protein